MVVMVVAVVVVVVVVINEHSMYSSKIHVPIYSKGRRSRSLNWLMLRWKMHHIFWRERPTNFSGGLL